MFDPGGDDDDGHHQIYYLREHLFCPAFDAAISKLSLNVAGWIGKAA
jgi:hypothetical protein